MGSTNAPTGTGRLAILVADDDAVSRMAASGLLGRAGHDVDTAIDGVEAVEAVARRHYDLVIIDLQMPELDGLEASRRMRHGASPCPRIVAMTATVDERVRRRCRDAGIDDVALKPLDAAAIEAILAGCEVTSAIENREEASGDLSATAFQRFRHDIAEHLSRTVREVVDDTLATMGAQIASMRGAITNGDRIEIARLAHALRGGAATIGAYALRDRAGAIENDAATVGLDALDKESAAAIEDLERARRRAEELLN